MSNIVKTRLPTDMLQFVQAKENVSGYIRDLIRADMNNESVAHNSRDLLDLYWFFDKQQLSKLEYSTQDIEMIERVEKYVKSE